ncbi:MAG: glycosyltransferase family 2 protein [Sphingomonadaceae bacterium]
MAVGSTGSIAEYAGSLAGTFRAPALEPVRFPATAKQVSVVIINYNGRATLPKTIDSIKSSGFPFAEIIVVDDGSTDGSADDVRANHPDVRLVSLPENTRNTSFVRNSGLKLVTTPFALLLDNDVTVLGDSVEKLLDTAQENEKLLAITPRLLDEDDRDSIYMDGSVLHFLGLTMKAHREKRACESPLTEPFSSFGSGIMLMRMAIARKIGLFDEAYEFGWGDDGEFHVRGRLMGYDVLHHPGAPFLHAAKQHGKKRAYAQLHNRYRFMFTYYSRATLVVLLPSLLIFEIGLLCALIAMGLGRDWTRAVSANWRMRKRLMAHREMLQRSRRVRDHDILSSGYFQLPGMVANGKVANALAKLIALPLNLNWFLADTLYHL